MLTRLERFLTEILVREIREIDLKLAAIEVKLNSLEARLNDLHMDMRKILERSGSKRWPI